MHHYGLCHQNAIVNTVNIVNVNEAIHYVTHHLCHAAAAFFTSPFADAAILTADGYGESSNANAVRNPATTGVASGSTPPRWRPGWKGETRS